jgi:hypothetical protein
MGAKTKLLLERGYFPSQLPPGFVTASYASVAESLNAKWKKAGLKTKAALLENFSVARTGFKRRVVSLPNPVPFLELCLVIDENWGEISKHLKKSRLSASTPKVGKDGRRAVTSRPLNELYPLKILKSRGYQYMLRTDVSRFFPTIYTHSLSWALHSKAFAKKNKKNMKLVGNVLDTAAQRCQDWQTLGIPIGPDTSHILAEIVAVALDLILREDLGAWPAGFRFVDDYFLFFEAQADAEQALARLSAGLKEFELEVNFDKTAVIPIHALTDDAWTHPIRALEVPARGAYQLAAIHNYFDTVLTMSRLHPDESVVKYALRRISTVVIKKDSWPTFEAHLLRAALAQPTALQVVAAFLCTYQKYGYPIDGKAVSKICAQIIEKASPLNHHSEVVWALWICKELKQKLRRSVSAALDRVDSACCKLLALDLESKGLLTGKLRRSLLKSFAKPEALFGSGWILSYEAGRRSWAGIADAHIKSSDYFRDILAKGVAFYDETATVPLLFTPKDDALANLGIETAAELFDKDIDWENFLNFEEPSSDYQDKGPSEFKDDIKF